MDAYLAAIAYGFPLGLYLFLFSLCIVGVLLSLWRDSKLLLAACFLEFFLAGLLAIGNGRNLFDLDFSVLFLPSILRIIVLVLHYFSIFELSKIFLHRERY